MSKQMSKQIDKQIDKQTNNKRLALKKGQIAILEALYGCRFCSCRLLADRLGITSGSSLHEKLNVLETDFNDNAFWSSL